MKKLLATILATASFITLAYTQQRDDNAYAGKNAIFIYHGLPPASPTAPEASGGTGYVIQRKEKAEGRWVTIDNTHFPQSLAELSDRYQQASKLLPEPGLGFDAPEAWKRWQKYHSFDSLRSAVAYPAGQMAFGFLLADTTVTKEHVYQYRILLNNQPIPAGDELSSNAVPFPAKVSVPVPHYLKRQTEYDAIRLQWAVKGSNYVPAFIVYRKSGSEKNFSRVNAVTSYIKRNDSLIYLITDDKIMSSEAYRYYITPVNGFGGGGNVVSDTISATGMNPAQLLTPQFINTTGDLLRKAILINYALADPGYIGSVRLLRSENYDTGYIEMAANSGADTSFTDYRIVPGKKYYYYLLMTDKLGRNGTRSIKTVGLFQDTLNSFPARFVEAAATKNGIEINWNTPPDTAALSGFYVSRDDGQGNGFQRLTALIPYTGKNTYSYTDTSHALKTGMQYAYSVQTENLSNRVSKQSNIAYASPAAALRTTSDLISPKEVKVFTDTKGIRLVWYDMRLVNTTQAYYRISRKTIQQENYTVLEERYPASLIAYTDSTVVGGNTYQYAVEGIDAAGNGSGKTTSPTIGITETAGVLPQITAFSSATGVTVTWTDAVSPNTSKQYLLYKYLRGEKPIQLAKVNAADKTFTDKEVVAGKKYYYFLTLSAADLTQKSNTVYGEK